MEDLDLGLSSRLSEGQTVNYKVAAQVAEIQQQETYVDFYDHCTKDAKIYNKWWNDFNIKKKIAKKKLLNILISTCNMNRRFKDAET